ncbi:putative transcription regulator mTERF family [Medicago truncatula]|uniref:Putative transcription regulator mTERF family n=1 Tax=Medicago truncatula TaxID=3880 RepID=A0A072TKN3_MEDTR|nr:transcription termination factor MTEF18, mitochondrial [Medicago truncatula]KEH17771.1 transcription termination factor family protein [Medicago truncatula]RHN38615.1 putative transcription regulator mTERF family [Medicago truncatula]
MKVMLLNNLKRHFCSNITTTLNSSKKEIPCRYKKLVVSQAQKALTEYLHSTRSIPYAFADQISKNSFHSLSNLISKLGSFSPKKLDSFTKKIEKFLRYNPINEFEFFFESIGIHHTHISSLLPNDKFFFCDDGSLLDSACVLCEFGFPWDKLGVIYTESGFMFRKSGSEIKGRLCLLKRYGFCNVQIVAICLTFPFVFGVEEREFVDDEVDRLLSDLRLVFLDFDLVGCVEGNVDVWYDVCRKIKVFYDLSDGKGKIGELIGRNKHLILEYGEEELIEKVEFFCRFSVEKEEVARLILQGLELLSLNLEATINVLKLLKHIGVDSTGLGDVKKNYAYALGTIKMANLPNVMRAMGLREWFFDKIKDGNHKLLVDFITSYPNEEPDKGYQSGFKAIHDARLPSHNMSKLNFMHTIGFGENAMTMDILTHMHGTSEELHKRFDCLLHLGIEFSKLCKIITKLPKILSQNPETLEKKINFLCQDMGHSLELLDTFPAFISFDLENRIKPRFRFHMWALEKGLYSKNYSIASLVATSDKGFVGRVFKIHPAAPKHWFEQFYPNKFRAS